LPCSYFFVNWTVFAKCFVVIPYTENKTLC
jgi:hypothetical protein